MKKFLITIATIACFGIAGVVVLKVFNPEPHPIVSDTDPARFDVSWMTSWATTGQLMVTLRNTNIPEAYDCKAEFPNFLFGPDMNEAAIAGRVDATNTGIVPTINLIAADDDWIVISRLIYFPVSILVPNESDIKSIGDLKGKSVGVPFGGGSHPYLLQRLEENGLLSGEDSESVKLINLKPPEQPIAFKQSQVDAVATWEPQTALVIDSGGRVIDQDTHVGFLAVRRSFAKKHPDTIRNLLKSYLEAAYFVSQNKAATDKWFVEISNFKPELLKQIEVVEPNVRAKSFEEIDLNVSRKDTVMTQAVADVMFKNGLITRKVEFESHVDMSFLKEAIEELRIQRSSIPRIEPHERYRKAG